MPTRPAAPRKPAAGIRYQGFAIMEADNRARGAGSRTPWRTFDGSIAVSFSMLLAALLKLWKGAAGWPLVGQLHQMTQWEDGVIIVATLLLFPTALALYGGFAMFFAAKEAVEKRAMERGRRVGRQEGREAERARISKTLAQYGVPLTPEQIKVLSGEIDKS